MLTQSKLSQSIERNTSFEAICHAVGLYVRSTPSHEPLIAIPAEDPPYWLTRYPWGNLLVTIYTEGRKVIVSVHHKSDFVSLANMDAVIELEGYLNRQLPSTKFTIKQIRGGK